jgi:hypothetical protein
MRCPAISPDRANRHLGSRRRFDTTGSTNFLWINRRSARTTETGHTREYFNFLTARIKVFLQVEPGMADVNALIDLVLDSNQHHPSIIGFGVDVEWYQNAQEGGTGVQVSDALAQAWEERVKAHSTDYQLFLKHWDSAFMPPTYRGDIVFVDDGQQFGTLEDFIDDMAAWADTFDPNTIIFQYGYPSDKTWWASLAPPGARQALVILTDLWADLGDFA